MTAYFNLNSYYFLVMLFWQFEQFFTCQLLFTIFATYVPRWRCSLDNNTHFEKNCTIFQECSQSIEYETKLFHSVSQEYNWICGAQAYMSILYSQIQFFAVLIGISVFGCISDRFGRKPVAIVAISLGIISLAVSSFSPSWEILLVTRFLVALSIGGKEVVCTYAMELILPEQRMLLKAFNWGVARFLMTLFCFLFPDWRSCSFACASFSLPALLILLFVLPESPAWLHNKVPKTEINETERNSIEVEISNEKDRHTTAVINATFRQMIRSPTFVKKILLLWIMWFSASYCGYLNDLSSPNITGNLFVNQFLFSAFIAASKPFLVFVDSFWISFGRRKLLQFTWTIVIVAFASLVVMLSLKPESDAVLVINVIGIVFIEFAWDVNSLCTVETIPTGMRATVMSSCSFISRCGALLTPLMASTNLVWPGASYLSIVVVGLVCLIASSIWLYETKGVVLITVHHDKTDEEIEAD